MSRPPWIPAQRPLTLFRAIGTTTKNGQNVNLFARVDRAPWDQDKVDDDPVIEDDREWFKARAKRHHRLRQSSAGELAVLAIGRTWKPITKPVRFMQPGVERRMKFFQLKHGHSYFTAV